MGQDALSWYLTASWRRNMVSELILHHLLISIGDGDMGKNVKEESINWVPTGLCPCYMTELIIPLSLKVLISKIYWTFCAM